MDNLSLAAMAASAFPVLFSPENNHIEVPHCGGIVALSYNTYPCMTTEPEKYPNWECVAESYYGSLQETYHGECIKINTGTIVGGYYCTCPDSSRYNAGVFVKISDSTTWASPSAWFMDKATTMCLGCRDGHEKKIPCWACGEIHD